MTFETRSTSVFDVVDRYLHGKIDIRSLHREVFGRLDELSQADGALESELASLIIHRFLSGLTDSTPTHRAHGYAPLRWKSMVEKEVSSWSA